jgi:hypothetical protein
MQNINLSKEVELSIAMTPGDGAAGQTDIECVALKLETAEGVMLAVQLGTIVAGGTVTIKLQGSVLGDFTDATELTGTSADYDDSHTDSLVYCDLVKPLPTYPYVRGYIERADEDATIQSAVYLRYDTSPRPVTHGADVAGVMLISPAAV